MCTAVFWLPRVDATTSFLPRAAAASRIHRTARGIRYRFKLWRDTRADGKTLTIVGVPCPERRPKSTFRFASSHRICDIGEIIDAFDDNSAECSIFRLGPRSDRRSSLLV
jgi:hypothetical protein